MTPEQEKTLNSVAICVEALLQLVHPAVLQAEIQKVHAKMAAAQEKARLDAEVLSFPVRAEGKRKGKR